MRSSYRRSTYSQDGQPITLAFVACIADLHPEVIIDAAPPLPEPKPLAIKRPPRWGEKLTRNRASERMARALNRVGYEAAMRRIDSGGV